jgi:hypothetical protein
MKDAKGTFCVLHSLMCLSFRTLSFRTLSFRRNLLCHLDARSDTKVSYEMTRQRKSSTEGGSGMDVMKTE